MSIHPKTSAKFVALVKESPIAFVKWGASWCGPCKAIQPHFDRLATTYAKNAVFIVIEADAEEFEALADAYKISSLPTFHVFLDSKLVKSQTGANTKALENLVKEYAEKKNVEKK